MANLQSPMTLFKFTEVATNKKNPDQTHNATEGGGYSTLAAHSISRDENAG